MKKQMPAFLLIILTLGLCSLFCFAEEEPSAASNAPFSDISPAAWYAEAVAYCHGQGWMPGTSQDTFSPEGVMTRTMPTAALYRRAGSPAVTGQDDFADTDNGAWYSDAVLWASENGMISGYDNGLFGVQDPVTREQLVTILWRLSGCPAEEQEPAGPFADQNSIAPYALPAAVWAKARNIVSGKENNRFDPQGYATRGEVALILMNHDRAFSPSPEVDGPSESPAVPPAGEQAEVFYITANGHTFTADFAPNSSADALRTLLTQGDLTVTAHDYGNFEKVGSLDASLPTNDAPITTAPGDVILYQGSNITLYYDRNSWSLTRLGTVREATREGLLAVLGTGDVTLTFSLAAPAAAEQRVLVAYFSATNTTRPLAEYAADILGGDLYEILPAEPYTAEDLNYYTGSRADREQGDPGARPAISGSVDNMADYDIIFIGYPIWHGQAPRIISTFLEGYDMSGKTIVPFCTSHSSGIGSSDTDLHGLTDNAGWLPGKRFPSGASRSDMEHWLCGLPLKGTVVISGSAVQLF